VKVVPFSDATVPKVGGVPVRADPPVAPDDAAFGFEAPEAVPRRPVPPPPMPAGAAVPVSLTREAAIVFALTVPVTLTWSPRRIEAALAGTEAVTVVDGEVWI
jgi:hypothetical protein